MLLTLAEFDALKAVIARHGIAEVLSCVKAFSSLESASSVAATEGPALAIRYMADAGHLQMARSAFKVFGFRYTDYMSMANCCTDPLVLSLAMCLQERGGKRRRANLRPFPAMKDPEMRGKCIEISGKIRHDLEAILAGQKLRWSLSDEQIEKSSELLRIVSAFLQTLTRDEIISRMSASYLERRTKGELTGKYDILFLLHKYGPTTKLLLELKDDVLEDTKNQLHSAGITPPPDEDLRKELFGGKRGKR